MEKEKAIILSYDVDALKRDILHLELDIQKFSAIAKKSKKQKRDKQAEVFSKAIEDAKKQKNTLQGYVRMIEEEQNNGNRI